MANSLNKFWIFDPNRDALENWQNAEPLHFAWFAFSGLEEQDRYRDGGSKPNSFAKSLQFEMRLELRERISNGEFIALGIPTSQIPKGVPEQIAKAFFAARSVNIDWDHDRISGLGMEIHEVRLGLANAPNANELRWIAPIPTIAKRGGGRPSRYSDAKEVLEILFCDVKFRKMRAAALHEPFNKEFKKRFSRPDQNIASVSDRSLRDYIKRYWKELAETDAK